MDEQSESPYDYREIDDVIHGRVRLSIMAYLSSVKQADFNDLKAHSGGSDGNLSVQLRKLEEAGYLDIEKNIIDRKTRTLCRLTEDGRSAWIAYIEKMQQLLVAPPSE